MKKLLQKLGIELIRRKTFVNLVDRSREYEHLSSVLEFFQHIDSKKINFLLKLAKPSKAQIHQDLFVLAVLDLKREGFFVEFGATNGKELSNTWLLEKELGWKGILAEPGRGWHGELSDNRNCFISDKCVWKVTGETLLFNEASVGGFSTINTFSNVDRHSEARQLGTKYQVQTISLTDLLDFYDAPGQIDYLSIDTEGSEFDILSTFDFSQREISMITVEHNNTENRQKIYDLLSKFGYERVLTDLSKFDDWYVKPYLLENIRTSFPNC